MTSFHNGEVEKTGQQRLGTLVHVAMSLLSGGLGPRDGYINRPVFLDGLLIRYTSFAIYFGRFQIMIPLEDLEGLNLCCVSMFLSDGPSSLQMFDSAHQLQRRIKQR